MLRSHSNSLLICIYFWFVSILAYPNDWGPCSRFETSEYATLDQQPATTLLGMPGYFLRNVPRLHRRLLDINSGKSAP